MQTNRDGVETQMRKKLKTTKTNKTQILTNTSGSRFSKIFQSKTKHRKEKNALNITRKSNFILNPLVRKKSKKLTDKKMRTNDDDVKTQVQKKKKSKSISQKQTKWIQ
jgi:hypothetical protein